MKTGFAPRKHLALIGALLLGSALIPSTFAAITGHWDFENGDLSATIGSPLTYRGTTAAGTQFGTTTSFGIADINGQPAKVMKFPASTPSEGYVMTHGAAPNGGGTNVNQYTLIIDVLFPSTSVGFGSFLQTDTANTTDGDLFVNLQNGIGISGDYQGNLTPDVWHRVAFTVDMITRELGKFIDGVNVLSGPVGFAPLGSNPMQYLDPTVGGVDQRWSLQPIALLFADDNLETRAGYVNSIQFRDVALTPAQIAALGGPTAAGISVPIVANLIAGITVSQNAPDTVIDLGTVFQDAETPDSDLVYSVQANSNPALVSATADNTGDSLTLHYQPNQTGTATITVRATDAAGLYAEDSFVVTVNVSPPAMITVRKNSDGTITLEWSGDAPGELRNRPSLGGLETWSPIAGAASPYTFTPSLPTGFFVITDGSVYSANAVGYVKLFLRPGLNLIQNPLDAAAAGGNTVSNILAGVPDGTTVYRYTNTLAGSGFIINDYSTLFGWGDPNMSMSPGEGVLVFLPGASGITRVFIGDVKQGLLVVPLAPGFNLVGSQVPEAGMLQADLKYIPINGDLAYVFSNPTGYTINFYDEGWDPTEPPIVAGEALWIRTTVARAWNRSFSATVP